MEQSILEISFKEKFDTSIVMKVHGIFAAKNIYSKMTNNTLQKFKKSENYQFDTSIFLSYINSCSAILFR